MRPFVVVLAPMVAQQIARLSQAREQLAVEQLVTQAAVEALDVAVLRFEPVSVRDELKIEESEVVEPRPGEPKGVYSVSAYQFFPGRELEEGQGA